MPSLLPASILAHLTPDCSFVSPLPPFPPPLSLLSSQGSGTDSGRGWYKHKKWMPIGSPKKFGGVECNDEGNVIEMILPSMNIVGVIPCNTFQFLPHLLKVGVCIVCDVCVHECTVDGVYELRRRRGTRKWRWNTTVDWCPTASLIVEYTASVLPHVRRCSGTFHPAYRKYFPRRLLNVWLGLQRSLGNLYREWHRSLRSSHIARG